MCCHTFKKVPCLERLLNLNSIQPQMERVYSGHHQIYLKNSWFFVILQKIPNLRRHALPFEELGWDHEFYWHIFADGNKFHGSNETDFKRAYAVLRMTKYSLLRIVFDDLSVKKNGFHIIQRRLCNVIHPDQASRHQSCSHQR